MQTFPRFSYREASFIFRARRCEHGFHAFNETAIDCRAAAPNGFATAHGELAKQDGQLHEQGQEGFDGEVATGASGLRLQAAASRSAMRQKNMFFKICIILPQIYDCLRRKRRFGAILCGDAGNHSGIIKAEWLVMKIVVCIFIAFPRKICENVSY